MQNGGKPEKVLQCNETTIDDPIPPACWYRPGHGHLDLISAIGNSCDTYFSKIFTEQRYAELLSVLWEFKLIDNYEYTYLKDIPAAEKRKTWIGVGKHLLIPPEELMLAIYGLVSRGYLYQRNDSLLLFQAPLPIENEYRKTIREGMRESSLSGTTQSVQEILGMREVFAKTGTATYYYNKEDYTKTHGYLICFYPYPEPRYGILVFMLDGNGKTAAREGARLFKAFLDKQESGSED
jgi:cell division protein FtsI/penicillin-binding protein 2